MEHTRDLERSNLQTPIVHHITKPFVRAYLRIAEPRVIRILQFGIYISLLVASAMILNKNPISLQGIVGQERVVLFGLFLGVGSLLGAVAVLPGIWWLERVAIILLVSGLLMYLVMVVSLQSSPVGVAMTAMFILTFIQRWLEIKGSQLAPLAPKRG